MPDVDDIAREEADGEVADRVGTGALPRGQRFMASFRLVRTPGHVPLCVKHRHSR